jgi:putative nucleotidyltransferase with HDIG domain
MSSVRALARAIDSKDRSTNHHSERVAELAERLALELGWTTKRARQLHACGLLHDVGKIGIPDSILLKPGKLDPAEFAQVRRHAELSASIAAEVLEDVQVSWIRSHHERWGGGGYPDGLRAHEIPDGAQLLALADAWDVMTQSRTYKAALTESDALAECRRERGRQFAPAAVDALLALAARGTLVAEPAA